MEKVGCDFVREIFAKKVYCSVCVIVCVCVYEREREREREREDGESKLFGSWVPKLYNVEVLDSLFADFLRFLAVFSRPSMENCT